MPAEPQSSSTESSVWNRELLANPHVVDDKPTRVRQMFAAIAPSYDLNNRLHSLFIDQYWRRKTVQHAGLQPTDTVVDIACGTGDLTLKFADTIARLGGSPQRQVIGIDFTYEMLPIAQAKTARRHFPPPVHSASSSHATRGTQHLAWLNGDAQALPLPDACCDVVSIAFGIRNVQDPLKAMREFRRVLRPGGRLLILEFSIPTNPLIRSLYNFYCTKVMPHTATWISRDTSGAYKYLPHSVDTFLTRTEMLDRLNQAGFITPTATPLTFGSVVLYRGFTRT